jgi:hypothetical protein
MQVAITWLLLGGCGALTDLNAVDGGIDGRRDSGPADAGTDGRRDAGPADAGAVLPRDATKPGDAMCPGATLGDANGSPWSSYSLAAIDGGKDASFYGIWGSGSDDVWAVGAGAAPGDAGMILHWNGGSWAPSSTPPISGLGGVWGSGSTDVWAVGGDIVHWDGSAWSIVDSSDAAHFNLSAVWGSGGNDVWAVGGSSSADNIWHWDGSAWSLSPNAGLSNTHLLGVWGSGPGDVWAVGAYSACDPSFMHWDGSAWSVSEPLTLEDAGEYSYDYGFTPESIWGSGPDDVWVVGASCNEGAYGNVIAAWHYDGVAWSDLLVPLDDENLAGVWGTGPCDVWTVGTGSLSLILHWAGGVTEEESGVPLLDWSYYMVPYATHTKLFAVWGSGAGDQWVTGEGAILHHQ